MADTTRLSQLVAEIVNTGDPEVRLSQLVAEVANNGSPETRLSQLIIEVIEHVVTDVTINPSNASIITTGQAPILLSTIPVASVSIAVTGQTLSASLDTHIIIGNASLLIVGQNILLLDTAPVGNVNITVAGQSLTVLNRYLIEPDNVNITITGQSISLSEIVPIANGNILFRNFGLLAIVWGMPPVFEIEELVLNPEPGISHDPCGHWHLGIADEPEWDFVNQPDLPIPYHEHPTKPEVCGHWHKQSIEVEIICIDYVDQFNLDDSTTNDLNYAMTYGGDFLWVGSLTGVLLKIDPVSMDVLQRTEFSNDEIDAIRQIEYFDDILYVGCSISGSTGWFIQKVTTAETGIDFALIDSPIYAGTVVRGSDGFVYGSFSSNRNDTSPWNTGYHPITGGLWSGAYERIMDDYAYYIYANHSAIPASYSSGANIRNFQIVNSDSFLTRFDSSALISGTATVAHMAFTGTRLAQIGGKGISSPGIILNSTRTKAVEIRNAGAATDTRVEWIDVDAGGISLDSTGAVTGLLDFDGTPRDQGLYHIKTIWHTNNRVYYLGSLWPERILRIWSIIPGTFDVLHQYMPGTGGAASFTILDDFVYLMQSGIKGSGFSSAWIKLDLDLNFICIEDCRSFWESDKDVEFGANIVHDGNSLIFNYSNVNDIAFPEGKPLSTVTKYIVTPNQIHIVHGHDPRWDFTKQPIKL